MKFIILTALLFFLCACSSVTVRTDKEKKTRETPSYEKRHHYFWWGLKGNHEVNVRLVCKGKNVEQMQAIDTFGDTFLGIVTLGIYSPRTARVWCMEETTND